MCVCVSVCLCELDATMDLSRLYVRLTLKL